MSTLLQNIVDNSISDAAVVTDNKGNILAVNIPGREFLEKFGVLDESTGTKLTVKENKVTAVLKSSFGKDEIVKQDITLGESESVEEFEVTITPFATEGENSNLIVFKKKPLSKDANYKFYINSYEIERFLEDETVNGVIEKVKSAYPFTFIGRQKIQRDIDKLNGVFLIKDISGKIIISNKAFADIANMKVSQLQGKSFTEFFNSVETEIIKNADSFINNTKRPIIFSLSGKSNEGSYVQLPLIDIDDKVVALICFSAHDSAGILESHPNTVSTSGEDFEHIKELREPVLLLDKESRGKYFSNSYEEVFLSQNVEKQIDPDTRLPFQLLDQLGAFQTDNTAKSIIAEEVISGADGNEYKFQFRKVLKNSNLNSIVIEAIPESIYNSQSELKGKMYDLIMHTSPEPMFIYDIENLSFIEVNHAALKLYGFTRDEFLEMDLTDLYAPEDIQTLIESSPSKTTTSEFTGPYRHKHKNGNTILVEISKSLLEFEGKKGHFNILRDVTKLLEEKKELKKYKSIYEHSGDLLVSTDSDGFITSFNKNFKETLGYSEDDLDQKPMLTLVCDEDRARLNAEIFHSEEFRDEEFVTRLKKADGSEIPVGLFANAVFDYNDEIDSYNIIVKSEQEVQREIITREVPSTKAPIDSSFLSNLFHEILTPINVITGFVQELSESIQKPTSDQHEAISYIKDNQQLLLQIMDNAVEYSNLEQNEVDISSESVVFVEILEEIEDNVIKFAKSREVEFAYGKISSSLKFESDKSKFSTFVSLIARFAVSATDKGKIFLSAYQKTPEIFVISFKDDRHSVSDDLVKNLKDIFTIDENIVKQNFGISRFAVRLARKLAKLLNVRRDVVSENGRPVEFSFDFPLLLEGPEVLVAAPSDEDVVEPDVIIEDNTPEVVLEEPTAQTSEPPKPVTPPDMEVPQPENEYALPEVEQTQPQVRNFNDLRCLYVEDQIDSQILFKVQMKDLHAIEFATSFEKALPLLQNKQFDFIVMDINLQGEYNGLDALRAIQKMPGFEHMPIIAVTAYVLPGDREKFIAAGFVDFITKPILRDKLENVLKKIFVLQ